MTLPISLARMRVESAYNAWSEDPGARLEFAEVKAWLDAHPLQ